MTRRPGSAGRRGRTPSRAARAPRRYAPRDTRGRRERGPAGMTIGIGVVFFSAEGATEALATAVSRGAAGAGDIEVSAIRVSGSDVEAGRYRNEAALATLDACAGILLGSPTYMGGPAAEFKAFADATGERWIEQRWRDKLAAGFTAGANPAGDQLATLQYLALPAAQHGMLWTGLDLAGGVDAGGRNRLGSQLGLASCLDGTDSHPRRSGHRPLPRRNGWRACACGCTAGRIGWADLDDTLANLTDPGARAAPDDTSSITIRSRSPPASDEAATGSASAAPRTAFPGAAPVASPSTDRDRERGKLGRVRPRRHHDAPGRRGRNPSRTCRGRRTVAGVQLPLGSIGRGRSTSLRPRSLTVRYVPVAPVARTTARGS